MILRQKTERQGRKDQLELFQTSLREVLGCIKYAKDKERLKEYITENTRMYMENAAAQVIKAITNTPITISEEEEEINVCQAVDEMIEDGRAEGRAEGELFGFIKAYTGPALRERSRFANAHDGRKIRRRDGKSE